MIYLSIVNILGREAEGGSFNPLSAYRYSAWGTLRYTVGMPAGTEAFTYTGQRQSDIGLYFYNARWMDSSIGRFISGDTVIPNEKNPGAYDRYAYALGNPVMRNDPTGHDVGCSAADPKCGDSNGVTEQIKMEMSTASEIKYIGGIDTGELLNGASEKELRDFATKVDELSLGTDFAAEGIVGGFTAIGAAGGLTFEGNPVTGTVGAGAGWILGETNPVTRGLMLVGNMASTVSMISGVGADIKSGDTRLDVNLSSTNNGMIIQGNMTVSSNSVISVVATYAGFVSQPVEMSMGFQSIAVANDRGVFPSISFSVPIKFP